MGDALGHVEVRLGPDRDVAGVVEGEFAGEREQGVEEGDVHLDLVEVVAPVEVHGRGPLAEDAFVALERVGRVGGPRDVGAGVRRRPTA